MTAASGEDLSRLDGNSAAGLLQEVFAVEMTSATCTCGTCRRVSAVGALYLYGRPMGCVLRCPSCQAIVLCITRVPAGHFIELRGVVRVGQGRERTDDMANAGRTLTKEQIEALRRRLEEERSRIVALLRAPTVTPASDDERSEYEETAQRTAEQSDQLEIGERERALLAEVEQALEKLRAGAYGIDETTGEPIPYERLAAIPWARNRAD